MIGGRVDDFWEMTPYELSLALKGYRLQQKKDLSLAWHMAYFNRVEYRKFPSLESLMRDEEDTPKRTIEQMKLDHEEIRKEMGMVD